MTIRFATQFDIPSIMLLINEVVPLMNASGNFQWDNTYPNVDVFENDIALNQLWVAEIEGSIAGISAITTDQEAEYADVGMDITEEAVVTHHLAVSPHYQGRGIATALLNQAEKEAMRRCINILRVDTNSKNQTTQKLFPKLGYKFIGEIAFSFRPGLRFYCYEKRIKREL